MASVWEPDGPRRRTILRAGVLGVPGALALTLAGCSNLVPGERRTPRVPTADEQAVERAIDDAARLRAAALALAEEPRSPRTVLRRIAADHAEHLVALGVSEGVTPTASASPGATPRAAIPTDAPGVRDAEWTAARTALRDALAAADELAMLLARIAAGRAVHADLMAAAGAAAPPEQLSPAPTPAATGPSDQPSGTGSAQPSQRPTGDAGSTERARVALTRMLTGEHAAVFAYPIVVARCAPARRATAEALWRDHIAERDALERLLLGLGADPPTAAPAYDVGPVPADQAAAAELAATLESGVAALAATAVGATAGQTRLHVARQLVTAARRTAGWGGSPGALPGAGTPSATPTPTST